MKITEITEYEYDDSSALTLRVSDDLLEISVSSEVILDKSDVQVLIDKLSSIVDNLTILQR